jgi:hypothetical protein
MPQQSRTLEPISVERAKWAGNALAVFTAETFSGDHPSTMDSDYLEAAIGDLICDLLHFARYHPRMDAAVIHARALDIFETELAEEISQDSSEAPPPWRNAFLNIQRLVNRCDEVDAVVLLDLIAA